MLPHPFLGGPGCAVAVGWDEAAKVGCAVLGRESLGVAQALNHLSVLQELLSDCVVSGPNTPLWALGSHLSARREAAGVAGCGAVS